MSVIAVKGVPLKWSLIHVVKMLAKTISGNFEALNFQPGPKGKVIKLKICYLRLSEKLDPVRVVEKINSTIFPKQFRPFAYIPDHVPDIPLASKPKKMPFKMRRALKVPEENEPEQVLVLANGEIMTELQSKYHALNKISKKTNHQLLEEIARKIYERLKEISDQNPEVRDSCFKLTQWYRRVHPHFGDFQLVLSTLHAVEDAAGTPRTQLQEKELDAAPPNPQTIDNLPFDKVQAACNTYTERILKKVTDHVNNLKSQVTPTDTEDEIVRKKVREELKKMAPFLSLIVRQVLTKHFIPRRDQFSRVRIYGEPFLPNKDTMAPFIRRYHASRVMRSERMFNCLRFNVPQSHYASLMAMDGTVLNGAKLIIRSSDLPQYKVPRAVLAGVTSGDAQDDDAMDAEGEDWTDMM
ncbi:hypothetical protein PYW08_010361 [Mythimna loreyi]|uniref:Uncharacterized protein n=1 Tax=Mythimna loreyi TaxID=667449 RepID=A0ACC2Q9E0_9NEOP|nr:hypothetical protein PYW08_010361 [Mythimna loreyi]